MGVTCTVSEVATITAIVKLQEQMEASKEQRLEILTKIDRLLTKVEHLDEVVWEQKSLRGSMNVMVSNVESLHTRVTHTETELLRQKISYRTNMYWVHGIWGSICAACSLLIPFLLSRLFGKPY